MTRRRRLGLVGTGEWALHVHGASAAAHPDIELIGVWGRNPSKAERVATALGTAPVGRFEDLLDQVDVLSFSVPPDVQVRLALQAAGRGIDLLLEKPLALEVPQARQLAAALNDVQTRVLFTRRWEPRTVAWLDALSSQGSWFSGRACFINALGSGRLASSPWRTEHGALWDVGPHAVSILEHVLGDVTEVQAAASSQGVVHVLFTHAGGAVSAVEAALTAAPAAAHTEVGFWGTSGRSSPPPVLVLEDVVAAHSAALTSIVVSDDRSGLDAQFGLHITEILAQAAACLSVSPAPRGRRA